jgi:hypothetical protein
MEKYIYDTDNNEKLKEVRVKKVWLKEDLMPDDSVCKELFPDIWLAIQEEVNVESRGFTLELKNLKQLISSSSELFIIIITTESRSTTAGMKTIGQRAYLSNRETFIQITWLMGLTNLVGCNCQYIHPPHEEFINEFIGEVYF